MGRDTAVRENYQRFMERFRAAAEHAGRKPEDIKIVAVSKTRTVQEIREVVNCGARIIGENRVQEARDKFVQFVDPIRSFELHMIGHLQTNKAKAAVELFDVVQSVDSLKLAAELNVEAVRTSREMQVLVEVNSSGEEQKYGFAPEKVAEAIVKIAELPYLKVLGIMTVGPLTDDESEIRKAFSKTHELFDMTRNSVNDPESFRELSMGMTDDFELAIAEGSTMVRIGRAIFGPRSNQATLK
jgi:hypothetical protein